MAHSSPDQIQKVEGRAMTISMAANLFMGAAGIIAAYFSHSQAVLMDGLFSLIGFTAALLGKRVARNATRTPDKFRPFGYARDEALFTTFRSLSLIGLVLFAIVGSAINIAGHINGEPQTELVFEPLGVYFVIIGITCILLWLYHGWAWRKTGRVSDVLRLESKAAAFDGVISAAAALGLVAIYLFKDGALASIAPVGDSIIVLLLCLTVISQYYADFMGGLGELAGVTASPGNIAGARRAVRATLGATGGTLHDLSMSKEGRQYSVVVYFEPKEAMTARAVDLLTIQLKSDLQDRLSGADVVVILSEQGRHLDTELSQSKTDLLL